MLESATLISASCTTGWFDFSHGELWLGDAGLLRSSLGLRESLRRQQARHDAGSRLGPTTSGLGQRDFTAEEVEAILAADRRNVWITRPRVLGARLHAGRWNTRLAIDLEGDEHRKLLWLNADPAYALLAGTLGSWLGDAFAED